MRMTLGTNFLVAVFLLSLSTAQMAYCVHRENECDEYFRQYHRVEELIRLACLDPSPDNRARAREAELEDAAMLAHCEARFPMELPP